MSEQDNIVKAKEWISTRAGKYLEAEVLNQLAWGGGSITPKLVDKCIERAFDDYRFLVEKFIKDKTGQLTTKDVAYYEQTRPSA
jgi:hypothetical protein